MRKKSWTDWGQNGDRRGHIVEVNGERWGDWGDARAPKDCSSAPDGMLTTHPVRLERAVGLEEQAEGHLDLPRTADGMLCNTQPGGGIVQTSARYRLIVEGLVL